jgi:hypothetical protein
MEQNRRTGAKITERCAKPGNLFNLVPTSLAANRQKSRDRAVIRHMPRPWHAQERGDTLGTRGRPRTGDELGPV